MDSIAAPVLAVSHLVTGRAQEPGPRPVHRHGVALSLEEERVGKPQEGRRVVVEEPEVKIVAQPRSRPTDALSR